VHRTIADRIFRLRKRRQLDGDFEMTTTAQQQFSNFATEQVEIALRFARISLDSVDRLAKLQVETAKTILEENAKTLKQLSSIKDVQEALAARQKISEVGIEQATAYSRSLYEISSQAQAEFSKLVDERNVDFNKNIVSGLDRFVKNAPAGADAAVAAVKSTVQATAAAVDSLTKAAKQVAEFADASVKAASTATADAVKTAAKKASSSNNAQQQDRTKTIPAEHQDPFKGQQQKHKAEQIQAERRENQRQPETGGRDYKGILEVKVSDRQNVKPRKSCQKQ
jgi:phasin family protein